MLDVLLHADSHSGTSSATSGSMGSGGHYASGASSNGKGTNGSSIYFGSEDSSQNSQQVKGHLSSNERKPMEVDQSEDIIKDGLQDPLWMLTASIDDTVKMTYQLPSRDIKTVLREDRMKLKQKHQPCFTEDQKTELVGIHPWLKKGGLPRSIDIKLHVDDGHTESSSGPLPEERSP